MSKVIKKTISIVLILTLVLSVVGCSRAEEQATEDTFIIGNNDDASDDLYTDLPPEEAPTALGNNEDESEDYIDAGFTPAYYTSIADIPEGTYCIAHLQTNEDGTQSYIYYPPYEAYGIYNATSGAASERPDRYMWLKLGWDEPVIPTMYEGDLFIFKSDSVVPTVYSLERFKDAGYTIGISGLQLTSSGNYIFNGNGSNLQPDSDTINMTALGAQDVYFVAVGDKRVTSANVSETGTITGLQKNKNYVCDIRTGTERNEVKFRANIHLYTSLEQYMLKTFYFSSPYTIELAFEKTMKTGYYCLNGTGMFRYISKEDFGRESILTAEDYNVPFISTDDNGRLISTVENLAIDSSGFIVRKELVNIGNFGY